MQNNLVDAIVGGKMFDDGTEIILTESQKLANVFTKKLLGHGYKRVQVNEDWFRPIYTALKGKDYDEEDMKIASSEIIFNDKIKKYYFEK